MQRIQQAERQRDVMRDLDGRERFTSAGFHLSETSSDVSHLPKHISGRLGGAGRGLLVSSATGRGKGDLVEAAPLKGPTT